MPFQIYFLVINPWEYFWSELYQISYYGAMAFGIYSAIATWIFVFFILSLGYFALGVAYSIYKLKNEIGALSIEEIDSGALTPIGSLAICLASCFLFGVSVNLALIVVAPLEWWAILEICMFSISVLLLFFLPIYDLHSLIVTKKEAAVKELKSNWWLAAKKHDHVNTKLIAGIEERIEKIPTWPFDTKTLLELSGYVVVPFIIWVVSYLTI